MCQELHTRQRMCKTNDRIHRIEGTGHPSPYSCKLWTALLAALWMLTPSLQGADHLRWNPELKRVDAELHDWKLAKVVQELARQTGWEIYAEAGLTRKVSVTFSGLEVGEALRYLLGGLNYAILPGNGSVPRLYIFERSISAASVRVTPGPVEPEGARATAVQAALRRLQPENLPTSHRVDRRAFGTNAVAELMAGLRDEDPKVRQASASALGYFGEEGRPAVAALIQGLDDMDVQVQLYSAVSLGRLGLEGDVVLPRLIDNLTDGQAVVRAWNADAIGRFPSLPEHRRADVIARLTATLEDSSPMVANHARQALIQLGAATAEPPATP